MANFNKFKTSGTLGLPPTEEDASTNLSAPEVAPGEALASQPVGQAVVAPIPPVRPKAESAPHDYRRGLDGRSARRTNRTVQFATRVTPEFDERIRQIAQRDNLLLVEVMEKALDAYEYQKNA
jgi:hypothetical protein